MSFKCNCGLKYKSAILALIHKIMNRTHIVEEIVEKEFFKE